MPQTTNKVGCTLLRTHWKAEVLHMRQPEVRIEGQIEVVLTLASTSIHPTLKTNGHDGVFARVFMGPDGITCSHKRVI